MRTLKKVKSTKKNKILADIKAVDAYRQAHHNLHSKPWHKGIPEEHTPLLKAMVNALEGLGFTSTEQGFESKKTEILAKFWADSDLLNLNELGFIDREDFEKRAKDSDREALKQKWN